jgi:hypothetical protein
VRGGGGVNVPIQVAFGFFALGILWLLIITFVFGIVEWIRALIG